ncbi:MAG: ASPIC/UnbV domain-containing protein [Betaproteobacteria bacterium]|nr:ASPIC/UnbV domain-containing protein [Betaproteobacteria bacterium]
MRISPHGHYRLYFGLGDETAPVSLDIRWPDGTKQTLEGVAINQRLTVKQPGSPWSRRRCDIPPAPNAAATRFTGILRVSSFVKATLPMIISHSHRFIFVKSLKTAGTSLEAALSNSCSGGDVVTSLGTTSSTATRPALGTQVDERGQLPATRRRADDPRQPAAGDLVRLLQVQHHAQPADRALSYFFWDKRQDSSLTPPKRVYHNLGVPYDDFTPVKKKFTEFIKSHTLENNDRFYVIDDQLCVDFVVRYEHRTTIPAEVCSRLGLSTFRFRA